MNLKNINLAAVMMLCLATPFAFAENQSKVQLAEPYVTINGIVQPNARAEILLRERLSRGVQDSPQLRDGVRDLLINWSLMEQAAIKADLDKEPLVQAQVDIAIQNVLAQAWQLKILSALTINDDEIKAEYDKQISRLGDKEYLIRHILVADVSTAKLLIEKLQSGSKMADLAGEYSRDTATQGKGGLTDWTSMVNFLPAIADVVPSLTKGQFTQKAVQTDLGWHILQLDDIRPFKAPTFESLKPQLTQIIARKSLEAQIKKMRDAATIK